MGDTYCKTATIEATQWFKMGDHPAVVMKSDPNRYADEGIPWCPTLEGGHVVTPGDWIATGVRGEHWPIKPDVFAETYALVSAALDAAEARAVGVKPLVWRQREDYFWAADSVCGMIYISEYAGMELPFKLDMPDAKDTFHATLELAQAAAKTHYDAAILSALHPASPLGAVTLAAAVKSQREATVAAMTFLLGRGVDALLIADQLHRADAALSAALAPFARKGE